MEFCFAVLIQFGSYLVHLSFALSMGKISWFCEGDEGYSLCTEHGCGDRKQCAVWRQL